MTLLTRSLKMLCSLRSTQMLLISLLMTLFKTLSSLKRRVSTTSTIQELLRDLLLMTQLTGLDLRVTFVLPMLITPRSLVLSMLKDTGESSSSTSLRDTDTVTTTTPRPPVLRPACSLTLLVVFLPLVTSPSVPRSMVAAEFSLLTLVTHTEGSSSILTSCLVLVLAISPPNLIQTKNQNQENHGLS